MLLLSVHKIQVNISKDHLFEPRNLYLLPSTGMANSQSDNPLVSLLAQLGRARPRYYRGHGFESRTLPECIFQALISQLLKLCG